MFSNFSSVEYNVYISSCCFNVHCTSFRAEWCDKWNWLHHNVELDVAYCHICMKASKEGKLLTGSKCEPVFISKGYWKEATSAFGKHPASQCHKEATEALVALPKQIQGSIGELLSTEHKKQQAVNRKMFLVLLQNICFLARQGLAFRSHDDVSSNFHQLLLLRSEDNPELTDWILKKKCKYTSHEIQNECLQILAMHMLID